MKRLVLLVLGALVAGVMGTVPATAFERDEPMSVEVAGDYYLSGVCPVHEAYDRWANRLWGNRKIVTRAEVERRLPTFRREARLYGKAVFAWSRHLYNPTGSWPATVAGPVAKVARVNAAEAAIRFRQGNAYSAQQWLRLNGRANRLDYGDAATFVRARLNLPATGAPGC